MSRFSSSTLIKNLSRYGALSILVLFGIFLLSNRNLPQKGVLAPQLCQAANLTDAELAQYHGIPVGGIAVLREQGFTATEICALSENDVIFEQLDAYFQYGEKPGYDFPAEAAAFRALQQQDEKGFIPADGLLKGAEHIELMRSVQGRAPNALTWTWLGPGNIGGRVRSIAIHPTTTTNMWAGSATGGIWKTTNGGTTWAPVNDFLATLSVSSIIFDPNNAATMYAGTGESFTSGGGPGSYARGAGVFKSVDGGTTWTQLASTANANWYFVNRLAISPNGTILLAATETGIHRSLDGGTSWTQLPDGDVNGVPIADIDFDPTDNNKAIASGRFGGGAYYSTDGGVNWIPATFAAPGSAGRVEIAYAPGTPTTVYASVNQASGEIWKSTDSGANYTRVNTGVGYLSNQGFYDNIIWVDPTNANRVIVGGIDLWQSIDGGVNLTKISRWQSSPNSAHADHHFIIEHPGYNGTTNKTVYFGNDGGIYRVDDVTTVTEFVGWQELNNNLGITQFYGAAGNVTSGRITGGTQDNGTLMYTGGTETWGESFGGDGGYSAADQTDPNYFYGEYVYLNIHRSTDAGVSADYISGQYWNGAAWVFKADPFRIPDAQTGNGAANFIAPFVLDPNNANRILGGGVSLWQTNDAKTANTNVSGPSWASIKPSIGSPISAIAIAPGNSDIVWVGHNNSHVYKTANATAATPTWTRVDLALPGRMVLRITIDATDNNVVYVTYGGFAGDNVYRTANAGTNWADITGAGATGLPDVPVRSLVINPTTASKLYVGTEVGVFVSEDTGATWVQDGPANVTVDELSWMGTTLVAATYGRGLFTATEGACAPPTAASALANTRNGGSITLNWAAGAGATSYEVHRQVNSPYFAPAAGTLIATVPATTHPDTLAGLIGNTANNYSYAIVAKSACGAAAAPSNRTGEFDFGITPGGTGPSIYKDAPAGGVAISNAATACGGNEIVRNIYVSGSFNVTDLNVGFNANHAYRGDILMTLQAPDATTVTLIAVDGGDGDQDYDILLDDDGGGVLDNNVNDNTAVPYYDRRVLQATLNTFAGKAAQGTWIMRICDPEGADDGTYNRSQLEFR